MWLISSFLDYSNNVACACRYMTDHTVISLDATALPVSLRVVFEDYILSDRNLNAGGLIAILLTSENKRLCIHKVKTHGNVEIVCHRIDK